ncbi:MAG: hypothetical protein WDO73_28375 [Ignavibacteriota bacterium]
MRTLVLGLAVVLTAGLAADLALIQPNELAAQLAAKGSHPAVIQVGPNFLYRGKHIPRRGLCRSGLAAGRARSTEAGRREVAPRIGDRGVLRLLSLGQVS